MRTALSYTGCNYIHSARGAVEFHGKAVDNAVDSAVEDAYNTAISDTNIYYMFILDSKNQVSEYIIQQLYNNRESLCDDYIKKFGQPSINNNVYCWNGQVNGTPAQFYLWIDTDEYNNYVWNIYVKKAN